MPSSVISSGNSSMSKSSEGEELFRSASDELYKVFSDTTLDNDEKIAVLLDIGLQYFGLDTAIVNSITGTMGVVAAIASNVSMPLSSGMRVALDRTPDSKILSNDGHSANHQCAEDELSYQCDSHEMMVGCYISTALHTVNGPYGSVSFFSANSRQDEFDFFDLKILTLISNWLGYLLGNAEQIEFMANQNEHYKSLFASIPTVMFLCDSDGLIISASNQFAETIGVAADMVPGNVCSSYFDGVERGTVRKAIADGHAVQLPAKLIQAEGVSLEVELNISVKPIGTMRNIRMVIATDVSARNAALREATEQNRLLEKANEGLNQFAFVASHDLQEPLRKIQQFSSFLEEDLNEHMDADSKYHLDVIVESSQRMSQLIKDLLSLSKTSSIDPDMSSVCLNKLVATVVDELGPLVNETGACIEIDPLPTVQGNTPLLNQLFTNLLYNGIKYRSSERKLKLCVKMIEEGGNQFVNVVDNGIGFDMEDAQRIFEPFHRLHSAKDFEGTGIGLAICKAVCEKHGWNINARSVGNEGSTFSIQLATTAL